MSLLCEIRISDIIEILSTIVALLIGVQSIRQSNKEIKIIKITQVQDTNTDHIKNTNVMETV